jgi:ribosomal protein S18 acetylase RimI-like enzyme
MAGNNKTQITSDPILFDPKIHQHLLPSFAAIHSACIMTDHSVITFLPPLSDSVILNWYSDRSKEVTAGTKLIVMQLARREDEVRVGDSQVIAGQSLTSRRSGESGELTAGDEEQSKIKSEVGEEELVGFVMLVMNAAETGPFRAPVEKLLISPEWRRMGVAKRLMAALETIAMEKGKTLMVCAFESR